MSTEEKLALAISELEKFAKLSNHIDDEDGEEADEMPDYYSMSGGNFDDAAEIGRDEAYRRVAHSAREILKKIKGE